MSELPQLSRQEAGRIASLVGIGGKSGDTVVGLSALRRSRPLAYVFARMELSTGTLRELAGWGREGALIYRVEDWAVLAGPTGRADASVIGIRPGALARGVAGRLKGSDPGE